MRHATGALICLPLFVVACSSSNGGNDAVASGGSPPGAGGANVGQGGVDVTSSATGGGQSIAVGGTTRTSGGGSATGGTLGDGGAVSTGGSAAPGGTTARGGAVSRGGNSAPGGTTARGGAVSTGGSAAPGGTTARGGTNAAGSGSLGGTAARGGTSPGGTSAGGAGTAGATGSCGENPGQLFGKDHPWNQRIDQTPLDSESAAIIAYLQQNHTSSQRFRVDGPSDEPNNLYGITVLSADASTPHQTFAPTDDFYSPDCDPAPAPVPAAGAIEGESSYACTNDGDCHLIVIDRAECRLYEMWRANRTSATSFDGGCLAVWDLRETYTPTLRGDCCTSADAAGLPIAAHMFSADEIAAGRIEHAIRFILPNNLMRKLVYVRPATHSTSATTGSASAPPYGARLRLKSTFDETKLKPAARVVARALKEYGMILSDGGNLTFTATNDRFTTHKWSEVDFTPTDLTSLQWSDFEVPNLGTRYTFDNSCDCSRTPITK